MSINRRELAAGLLFVAIGLYFALDAWFQLRIGRLLSMGPGYFPLVLGCLLIGLGGIIGLNGMREPEQPFGRVSWRGVALVIGSIVFFAVTVRGLGLALALSGSSLMAALASGKMTLRGAVLLAVVTTAFCILIFVYGLGLPYPVVGRWIAG